MNKHIFRVVFLGTALLLFVVIGCNNKNDSPLASSASPTQATVRVSLAGTLPASSAIAGVGFTLALPAGVTIKATPDASSNLITDGGMVIATGGAGAGSTVLAVYTAASGTVSGKVRALLTNTAGFSTGEFITLNCDIAQGVTPAATDFGLTGIKVVDGNGFIVNGLTAVLAADIK